MSSRENQVRIKDRIAALANAAGVILDGGLGAPKFPLPPTAARRRFKRELDVPHGYGDRRGHIEARTAVSRWYSDRFSLAFDAETEVRITEGSREILPFVLRHLNIGPDKPVVMATPYYGGHNTGVQWAGCKPAFVQSDATSNFFDGLEQALLDGLRPAIVIVSYVSNPTGLKCTLADMKRVVNLAHQHGFSIVSDRAYGELVYGDEQIPSVYQAEGANEVTLCETFTASKMFQAAQWRCGAVVGRADLMEGLSNQKAELSEGVCTPAHLAFATALDRCREFLAHVRQVYQDRAETAVRLLRETGWDNATVPQGGMFLWLPVPTALAEQGINSTELCLRLARKGIVMWPDVHFGGNGTLVRFCLREKNEVAGRACDRIADIIRRPEPASGGNLIPSFA